jgi:hypothetical protein
VAQPAKSHRSGLIDLVATTSASDAEVSAVGVI